MEIPEHRRLHWVACSIDTPRPCTISFLPVFLLQQTIMKSSQCGPICPPLHTLDNRLWFYLLVGGDRTPPYLHDIPTLVCHGSIYRCHSPSSRTSPSSYNVQRCLLGIPTRQCHSQRHQTAAVQILQGAAAPSSFAAASFSPNGGGSNSNS